MKKMTAMVLALGLAVPAQAWHLFPVREKVEHPDNMRFKTVQEIKSEQGIRHSYQMTALALGAGLVISLLGNLKLKSDNDYHAGRKAHYKRISAQQANMLQQYSDEIGLAHDDNLNLRATLRDNQRELTRANEQYSQDRAEIKRLREAENKDIDELIRLRQQVTDDETHLQEQTNVHRQEVAEIRTQLFAQMNTIKQERDRMVDERRQALADVRRLNEQIATLEAENVDLHRRLEALGQSATKQINDLTH
jgi:chromosome segregation ATPase